jgi:hypothetical protein
MDDDAADDDFTADAATSSTRGAQDRAAAKAFAALDLSDGEGDDDEPPVRS